VLVLKDGFHKMEEREVRPENWREYQHCEAGLQKAQS